MKRIISVIFSSLIVLASIAQSPRQQLNEVTVVASRTTNNAEGYITNLRGSDITQGKPAADILGFLPNISRENGNFKINGLAVSEIYVDGVKLSDLSELENIPGEMIDKVQVKYLAGSDSNAALSGGIILITLRRPPEGGYYGNLTFNADWYRACGFGNEGVGGLFNYRYRTLSIYDNLYVGADKTKDNSAQWFTGPDLNTRVAETSKSHGFNFRNRLSLTGHFNSGAQLGISYLIAATRPRSTSATIAEDAISALHKRSNVLVQEGTIRFSLPLNKKGTLLNITADYYNRNVNDNADYFMNTQGVGSQATRTNLNMWKAKTDILYPQSRKLTWKFGASAQWITSEFTPDVITESERFELNDIPFRTTGFTPIIYADAQGYVGKIRYSAGLNWQLNRIGYTDRAQNVTSHNSQSSINPTIQLMMPFGAGTNHALMLSYKRTLGDIPYTAISSVVNWSDANNYSVGNPNLKAQSADMIMAGLSLFRNRLNVTALYAHAHDRIYWQTFQSSENPDVFYTTPININGQGVWGLGAEWIASPAKWWRFKLSGRIEITPENTILDGIHYDRTRLKQYYYFNNSFRFGHGWGGTLNATFEPTYRNLDRTYHAVYNVSGKIYRTFLNDNIQVALDFTPIGNRRKLDRNVGFNRVSYKYTSPVQYIGVSLVWNFSGGKKGVEVDSVDPIQNYYETTDPR